MTNLVSTTCASDGTITTFTLSGEELAPVETCPVGPGVSAMALDRSGTRAWAKTKEPAAVATLALEEDSDRWRVVASTPTDADMTYLTTSEDGRFLLGVSYGGDHGQVWPLVDGVPGPATARIEHAKPHCVVERGGLVHVVCLGEDAIATYRLLPDGSLSPVGTGTVPAPEGSGPRHAVVSSDGAHLYCMTEFSGEVLHYRRDPERGTLTLAQQVTAHATDRGLTHSELGADPVAGHLVWGADLHLHDDLLVASERTESTLAVLPVAEDGSVGEVVCLVETERQPRGFAITRDGIVLCGGERSEHLSAFRLDDDGQLTRVARVPNGAGCNWVRVVER